ncbi:protein MAIN-LIKE 2 [Amborella trichopoda]|uniref:protein MAIN-LIKE 2 n=1 Tax=Amborella trichopoda TaxID=13333 RepID=UPI0005D41F78|nr:protein MAIN-LIKE 2 [Amborella trichopoda]|eukprot:XP_011629095.1 protein MAIN-LIKE 2 [Amborella trichopoda]
MTPNLFDVYTILGLFMDDEPVTCCPISDLRKFIEDNLGIVPTEGNLTTIKHLWSKVHFWELPPDASPVQIVRYIRSYLLFLISVIIFADASVATVPTRYLQFLEDIEQANKYARGAAALAYLYRSLEKTCTFKRRHFSGSATLMQVIWNPYFKPDEANLG